MGTRRPGQEPVYRRVHRPLPRIRRAATTRNHMPTRPAPVRIDQPDTAGVAGPDARNVPARKVWQSASNRPVRVIEFPRATNSLVGQFRIVRCLGVSAFNSGGRTKCGRLDDVDVAPAGRPRLLAWHVSPDMLPPVARA